MLNSGFFALFVFSVCMCIGGVSAVKLLAVKEPSLKIQSLVKPLCPNSDPFSESQSFENLPSLTHNKECTQQADNLADFQGNYNLILYFRHWNLWRVPD